MRRTTILTGCAALALAAGTVHAQVSVGKVKVNRDGDAPIEQVTVTPGLERVIGGDVGTVGTDSVATFLPLGTNPEADEHSDAEFLPDGSGVVVANRKSKNLVIFHPDTGALIRSINLSGAPQALAINPAGTVAVTANMYDGTASIVNLSTGAEVTIPTGIFPAGVAITPDGTRAVVHNQGRPNTTSPYGKLTVINLVSNTIERQIEPTGFLNFTFSVNFEWQGVGISTLSPVVYDNSTVLMPVNIPALGGNPASWQALKIDLNTGTVTQTPVAADARYIEVSGTKAYVIHAFATRLVTEIDVPSWTVLRTIPATADLQGPAVANAAGTKLAVAVQNNFQVMDIASGTFSANMASAASNPNALVRTRDGNHFVAVNFYGSVANFDTGVVQNFAGPSNYTIGAVSPVTDRVALFSAAFGEDRLLMNTTPGAVSQLVAGPTGPAPEADKPRVVAVNTAGTRAVTANTLSQTASIVDLTSGTVITQVPIQRRAGGLEITPDGTKAVIASRDGTGVDVINLATNAVTAITLGSAPVRADSVLFSPNSQMAYVNVVTNGDGVFPINLTTNTAGPKILTGDMGSVGTVFSGTAINPSGTMMVTCNTIQHTLSFIDLTTNTVTATVGVANQPVKAAFSPDGSKLFVTSYSSNTFTVLDASTNPPAPLGALNVGNFPTEIRVNSTGTRVYVQAQQAGSPFWPLIAEVDVTNPSSPVLMNQRTFAASNPTWAILGWRLSADNSKLYVARGNTAYTIGGGGVSIAEGGGLTVLSTADGTIIDETLTGRMPWSLGISGDESVMVTADINQDGITVHGEPTQGCYGNCDGSTTAPVLNVADFTCFLQRYAAGESYANCDGSTTAPVLNVADFTCFLQSYAAGCP